MADLQKLGDIERLSKHVLRVLGQNPGKFTLQGTNTYVIGSQNPYFLIDTGEGLDSYIPILQSALDSARVLPDQPDVSDIILSHWHHDHIGGLPSVLKLLKQTWKDRFPDRPYTPPRLHKYPASNTQPGRHTTPHNILPNVIADIPAELYTPSPSGTIFHDLSDGQTFVDSSNDSGAPLLRVLHTPGHTVDSICLYIPQDRALYTADTVLGHGTAVFEDLATYLASLNKMLHFGSPPASPGEVDLEYVTLYPAHGAIVANGRQTISTYIQHRLEREAQVLAVLRSPVPVELHDGANAETKTTWTTWNLVRVIYKAYPENLWLPAAHGIDLHLRKLEGDGVVRNIGGDAQHTLWKVLPRTPSL
ncbi:Endoribonuclease LACTB2 [Psilocybe cubensis]|uniref:Metallo-beta-lactamase domain-containing protein n=2 Tax=Psilocybe cubensis TaxID=181762 RepID=A0A8H8CNG0_PSICU|nr:Endoribonuclease LACTB2 [Psilocybe cubensis]KAH9483637.1 Endoribonuclease LACTB2 [Psilocybe cubensis]